MRLVQLCHSLHTSLLNSVIYRMSVCCRCTLKTQEFRTKDFVVRSTGSIERQKCKYCLRQNRRRVRNQEFLLRQAAKPSGELFSASPTILNYSVVNYNRQGKHRRLWRLAVATHPPIAEPTIILNIIRDASVPLRGTIYRWRYLMYPQLRCFAACSGFHDIGPAPRNPQFRFNQLAVQGCVATARRHSLLRLPFFCRAI